MTEQKSQKKKTKALELLHKELDINIEEQKLLHKRIDEIRTFLKDFSKDDPEYSLYESQVLADRVYLDELIQEEESLRDKIEEENL